MALKQMVVINFSGFFSLTLCAMFFKLANATKR